VNEILVHRLAPVALSLDLGAAVQEAALREIAALGEGDGRDHAARALLLAAAARRLAPSNPAAAEELHRQACSEVQQAYDGEQMRSILHAHCCHHTWAAHPAPPLTGWMRDHADAVLNAARSATDLREASCWYGSAAGLLEGLALLWGDSEARAAADAVFREWKQRLRGREGRSSEGHPASKGATGGDPQ